MSTVLRDPQKHFARAIEHSERAKFLAIRAKELKITDPTAATAVAKEASFEGCSAVWHVAQGLAALALLKEFEALAPPHDYPSA